MPSTSPRPARKKRTVRGDHHVIAFVRPGQAPTPSLLASALMEFATIQRAQAEGSPAPFLAGMHKLGMGQAATHTTAEGDDD